MGSERVFSVFSPPDSLTLPHAGRYSEHVARLPRRGVRTSRGTSSGRGGPCSDTAIATEDPHRPDPSRDPENLAPAPLGAKRWLVLALATAGGAGFAPVAPGTFGAAVGVLLFLPLVGAGSLGVLLATTALGLVGVWAAGLAERAFARRDDGRIVIDEVVGQLIALAPLPALAGPARGRAPELLAVGFVAFRLFDIWKPGPVRWAERRFHGGLGVMLDDVVAGVLAAGVVAAASLALGGSTA